MAIPAALPASFHPFVVSEEQSLAEQLKTREVPATMSASIRQAASTTPDPISQYIRLDGTSGALVYGLLDIERTAPIGLGAQVLEAKLLLYKAEAWSAGTHTLTIEAIDAPWDAATVTWASQPAVRSATSTVTVPAGGADGDLVEVNVTDLVAASVSADDASGSRWYGVRLRINTAGENRFYSAFGSPETRPKLRIKYNQPPDAPADLLPTDGRAVSEVRPELVWRFHDPDAGDALSFVRVQVATDVGFTTTVYDSTKVSHTTPRFDMASPPTGSATVSDLLLLTTYYWRAKHWDSHNLESDWSPTAEFTIVAKGTFSLLSPSGPTVDSPTPTVSWSLTGATQSQYNVEILRKVAGVWEPHWEHGWTVGTETSVTVPNSFKLVEAENYRVLVEVRDTINREDLAGDRAYYTAEQDVTLAALSV